MKRVDWLNVLVWSALFTLGLVAWVLILNVLGISIGGI